MLSNLIELWSEIYDYLFHDFFWDLLCDLDMDNFYKCSMSLNNILCIPCLLCIYQIKFIIVGRNYFTLLLIFYLLELWICERNVLKYYSKKVDLSIFTCNLYFFPILKLWCWMHTRSWLLHLFEGLLFYYHVKCHSLSPLMLFRRNPISSYQCSSDEAVSSEGARSCRTL